MQDIKAGNVLLTEEGGAKLGPPPAPAPPLSARVTRVPSPCRRRSRLWRLDAALQHPEQAPDRDRHSVLDGARSHPELVLRQQGARRAWRGRPRRSALQLSARTDARLPWRRDRRTFGPSASQRSNWRRGSHPWPPFTRCGCAEPPAPTPIRLLPHMRSVPPADTGVRQAIFLIPNRDPPTLSAPDRFSGAFNDFLQRCLVKDPSGRPTARELLRVRHARTYRLPLSLLLLPSLTHHPPLARARARGGLGCAAPVCAQPRGGAGPERRALRHPPRAGGLEPAARCRLPPAAAGAQGQGGCGRALRPFPVAWSGEARLG